MSKFSLLNMQKILVDCIGNKNFTPQVKSSLELAFKSHSGQYRESPNPNFQIPYIVHPVGVAKNAFQYFPLVTLDDSLEDIISACLTHDVLEDSSCGLLELEKATSKKSTSIVDALTKPLIKENLSREERNRLANEKIINGGLSAMYIKICDHLHNIGQPSGTPPRLLTKALDKGYQYYLNYFSSNKLPNSLKKIYLEKLKSVDNYLEQHTELPNISIERSFQDAVEYCDKRLNGKILETHDIVDILKEATGAIYISIKTKEDLILELSSSTDEDLKENWLLSIKKQLSNNFLDMSKLPKVISKQAAYDHIYVLNTNLYLETDIETLICAYKKRQSFNWVNRTTVDFLLTNLSTRLQLQIEGRKKNMAEEIAHLSLNTDVASVMSAGLKYNDLFPLKQWWNDADILRFNLLSLINYKLHTPKELPFIQSRTKEIDSIIRKIKKRKLDSFYMIDDLIGIRIVFLTEEKKVKGTLELIRILMDNFNLSEKDIIENEVKTKQGYIATHLTFPLFLGNSDHHISCEVQLKTIFQDVWAKAYRVVAYDKNISNKLRSLFSDLSIKCKEADDIITQISKLKK